jgi:hypothetical protein
LCGVEAVEDVRKGADVSSDEASNAGQAWLWFLVTDPMHVPVDEGAAFVWVGELILIPCDERIKSSTAQLPDERYVIEAAEALVLP